MYGFGESEVEEAVCLASRLPGGSTARVAFLCSPYSDPLKCKTPIHLGTLPLERVGVKRAQEGRMAQIWRRCGFVSMLPELNFYKLLKKHGSSDRILQLLEHYVRANC